MSGIETNLKELDYSKLLDELKSCFIKLIPAPSFSDLASQLAEVQGRKVRVSTMLIDAIQNKRRYEKLWLDAHDSELVVRSDKSGEQREAACRNKYREFWDAKCRAEDYLEIATQVYKDLTASSHDLTHQIDAMKEEAKLEGYTGSIRTSIPNDKSRKSGITDWGNIQ